MRIGGRRIGFLILTFFLLVTIEGCHRAAPTAVAKPRAPVAPGSALPPVQSPSGKTYARTYVGGPADEPFVPHARHGAQSLDNYEGSSRMAAKLSIVSATPEVFATIDALLDSLPSDETMRAMHIDKGPDSGRVTEEQRFVTVKAFIYASSKESDNDFHLIAGGDPSGGSPRYMNVEVSGLPSTDAQFAATLLNARNEFKGFFTNGTDALPVRGYERYTPPIPVTIIGSLFFDVDHVPPAVGPTDMKPMSAWEIHPVSDIQFEP